jgi:hypothetical protein
MTKLGRQQVCLPIRAPSSFAAESLAQKASQSINQSKKASLISIDSNRTAVTTWHCDDANVNKRQYGSYKLKLLL